MGEDTQSLRRFSRKISRELATCLEVYQYQMKISYDVCITAYLYNSGNVPVGKDNLIQERGATAEAMSLNRKGKSMCKEGLALAGARATHSL